MENMRWLRGLENVTVTEMMNGHEANVINKRNNAHFVHFPSSLSHVWSAPKVSYFLSTRPLEFYLIALILTPNVMETTCIQTFSQLASHGPHFLGGEARELCPVRGQV